MRGSGNSRLDTSRLDCLVRSYFVKGLAPSTVKTYACGWRQYLNFCVSAGLPAVQAGKDVLCKFAAALATEGLQSSPIWLAFAMKKAWGTPLTTFALHVAGSEALPGW